MCYRMGTLVVDYLRRIDHFPAAGLWNIGIEGQIMAGAIFTTGALRLLQNSSLSIGWIMVIAFMAGLVGGAIWAGPGGCPLEDIRRG